MTEVSPCGGLAAHFRFGAFRLAAARGRRLTEARRSVTHQKPSVSVRPSQQPSSQRTWTEKALVNARRKRSRSCTKQSPSRRPQSSKVSSGPPKAYSNHDGTRANSSHALLGARGSNQPPGLCSAAANGRWMCGTVWERGFLFFSVTSSVFVRNGCACRMKRRRRRPRQYAFESLCFCVCQAL